MSDVTRITLRPIANPLALGFLGLAVTTTVMAVSSVRFGVTGIAGLTGAAGWESMAGVGDRLGLGVAGDG